METFEETCAHLESYRGATLEHPFGPDTAVFKVAGKMFALTSPARKPLQVNLKCDPDDAVHLRQAFEGVLPGYHMNKRHWNTVLLDGSVPRDAVLEMMDQSYDLVVAGLTKKARAALARG